MRLAQWKGGNGCRSRWHILREDQAMATYCKVVPQGVIGAGLIVGDVSETSAKGYVLCRHCASKFDWCGLPVNQAQG